MNSKFTQSKLAASAIQIAQLTNPPEIIQWDPELLSDFPCILYTLS